MFAELYALVENGKSEVSYLEDPVLNQYVLGFEVLVQYLHPPQDLVTHQNLVESLEDLLLSKVLLVFRFAPHHTLQRSLIAVLHKDVEVVLTEAFEGYDFDQIGMVG